MAVDTRDKYLIFYAFEAIAQEVKNRVAALAQDVAVAIKKDVIVKANVDIVFRIF